MYLPTQKLFGFLKLINWAKTLETDLNQCGHTYKESMVWHILVADKYVFQ